MVSNLDTMERELLAWRALFAQLTASMGQPDAMARIRGIVGRDAPPLAGGLADTLWWEYVKLKQDQGGQLAIHELARVPVAEGVMVISYRREGEGWGFTPNQWAGTGWRRPGAWTHWGHMVLVPSHGPDGLPVLFDQCQERINTVRLCFAEQGAPVE